MGYTETFPTYAVALLFQALFLPVGGLMEERVGPRKTMGLAAVLLVAGTALCALSVRAKSLVGVIMTGGALFGAGVGLGYATPLVVGWRWLPRHKGLVSGVITAGFGGGL